MECRCFHHCPNGKLNSTCPAKGKCYVHLEAVSPKEHELRKGCLPPHKATSHSGDIIHFNATSINQCHEAVDHNSLLPENLKILCCDPFVDGNLCNDRLNMTPEAYVAPPIQPEVSMAIIIVISIGATCGILIFGTLFHRFLESKRTKIKTDRSAVYSSTETTRLMDTTTGSGQGSGNLSRRTIVKDLVINSGPIGQGRFGVVYVAKFRFDQVAVKYFYPQCEDSFQNETAIFHKPTINLRNENIVGFVASDIYHSPRGDIQRIVVMDYIPFGSLEAYLSHVRIEKKQSYDMCNSLVSGVSFLHMEINGQKGKESIAHRDLSNTSVMIKPNGMCCIGDFGRAFARPIRSDGSAAQAPITSRAPKMVYAPPEYYTADPLSVPNFDEMTAWDVWSLGLLLWEITSVVNNSVYVPAFFAEIGNPANLNIQFMTNFHCTYRTIPQEPRFKLLYRLILQCLTHRWQDRLTAYKVLKLLDELSTEL